MSKVGIFAGTFDPVHLGHLEFAKAAQEKAGLDKVYFLPERRPRNKAEVTDYKHRLKMLKLAQADVLELPEDRFSVKETLPKLHKKFPKDELYFLFGTDIAINIPNWPGAKQIQKHVILTGRRGDEKLPKGVVSIDTVFRDISSSVIRQARWTNAVPEAVIDYIQKHELYKII